MKIVIQQFIQCTFMLLFRVTNDWVRWDSDLAYSKVLLICYCSVSMPRQILGAMKRFYFDY